MDFLLGFIIGSGGIAAHTVAMVFSALGILGLVLLPDRCIAAR